MEPVLVTLENHTQGDTWQGIPTIGPILINGVTPSSPLAKIIFAIREVATNKIVKTIGTEEGCDHPALIVNAATWSASIPSINYASFNLDIGEYQGYLKVIDGDDVKMTLYDVRFSVTQG